MVRHGLKHIFQKPTPDIDSSDRTQQLRSKTVYAGTVNLAQHLVKGNNSLYKTYNGPYEIVTQAGNSNLIASRSYDDLLSITKGKVLLNQLPLNSASRDYYQQNFAKGQIYEGNYNRFDPSFNFYDSSCNHSVLVYDISNNGFTGPSSYETNGGYIGATGPGPTGTSAYNKHIFVDPDHCYYSDPCLLDASYARFVSPGLTGDAGPAQFTAQQIINADQYRGFSYPMPNFNLTCVQEMPDQSIGPLFCPPTLIIAVTWEYTNSPPTDLVNNITPTYNSSAFTIRVKSVVPENAKYKLSGITSVTNVGDSSAQVTLTGSGNFVGSISSPSIRVLAAPFTATWEYTNNGTSYNDLTSHTTAAYTSSAFAIRLKTTVPANATFTQSGITSVTNVGDSSAQVTLTGSGNFTGSISSPYIRVIETPFTATWEYTNNGTSYNDLTSDITAAYTSSAFAIRLKATVPANATFTQSGITSVTNVGDSSAQVTLTGSGNFTGSISSPSIRVVPIPFTATWRYTTDSGSTYTDLNSNDSNFVHNSSSPLTYTVSRKTVTPSNATFTQSGISSVTNVGDLAQITLTGTGNFTGSVTSPPIRVTPPEINIYNKSSDTTTKSFTDTPNFNGNGNNLVFGYTNPVNTTGNYYVSSVTNPSLDFDNTKTLYLHFFIPLTNTANPTLNPNTAVWVQSSYYLKGSATLTFVAADSKYVSTLDNNFVLESKQTYWTIWSQYPAGSFISNFNNTKLSMLIDDGGTGQWQWQGTLNVTKV
jgi:hypothetical protein